MASLTEEIADALARDVIRAAEQLGDDNLVNEIGKVIGASSTTTQEAFLTAVRVRQAEQRARKMLAERLGEEWQDIMPAAVPAPQSRAVPAPPPASAPARTVPVEAPRVAAAKPVTAPPANVAPAPQAPAAAAAQAPLPQLRPRPLLPQLRPKPRRRRRPSGWTLRPSRPPPRRLRCPCPLRAPFRHDRPNPSSSRSGLRPPFPPAPQTLAAKLALASALPRRNVPTPEPRGGAEPPPDIEIPDGDWG
jgi:hypothetical protein